MRLTFQVEFQDGNKQSTIMLLFFGFASLCLLHNVVTLHAYVCYIEVEINNVRLPSKSVLYVTIGAI